MVFDRERLKSDTEVFIYHAVDQLVMTKNPLVLKRHSVIGTPLWVRFVFHTLVSSAEAQQVTAVR